MSNSNSIHDFSANDFETFLSNFENNSTFLIVDFFATWCGPCKMMLLIFEKVATSPEFVNKNIYFAKINRDENREIIAKYGFVIPTIPRFFVCKIESGKLQILLDLGGTQSKTQMITNILEIVENEAIFGQEKGRLDNFITTYENNEPPNKSEKNENIETQKLENLGNLELKQDWNVGLDNSQSLDKILAQNDKKIPKIAIIGTGPAGLTAAIYAARASFAVTAFGGPQPGGQLTTTTEIENFPGAWDKNKKEGIYGTELIATMQDQAEHFGTKVEFGTITNLEYKMVQNKPRFTLTKTDNSKDTFDAVIIASGASARYLGVTGEEKYIGKGYHSCATCDGAFYRGLVVAIVGGGDSAMEEADFLTRFASKVYLLHRSTKFRASIVMLERVKKNPKIEIITDCQATQFIGENNLTSIILQNNNESQILENLAKTDQNITKLPNGSYQMKLDGLFVAIGHDPNSTFVANLLDKDANGYLIPQSRLPQIERTSKYNMATRIPGVFVAGDIEDHEYRQAITAAAGGCRAAMECEKWLADLGE